jgi:transposase-like protein
MNTTDESIVKADRRGRLRYTTEQKTALVEAYQSSGLSGPRFAELHGVNYQTLASWLQKRKRTTGSSPTSKSAFGLLSLVPAELHDGPATVARPLAIVLPGGIRFEVSDPTHAPIAAAMIRELQSQSPC